MIISNPSKVYQGKPCRRGHKGVRYIKGDACVDCIKLKTDESRARRDAAQNFDSLNS